MRIRKSQVLFPSSPSTVPLSDPNLINRSPVVVQLNDVAAAATTTHHASSAAAQASTLDRYQPFHQTVLPPIGKQSNGCDDPSGIGETGEHKHHNKQQPLEESVDSGEKKGNSHFRKGHLGLEIEAHDQVLLPPSNPSSTQDGRWCEGEKAIPLKKRRGSFENDNSNHHDGTISKKMKAKMKTKMNKKCSTDQNDDDMDWEEEDEGVRERSSKPDANVGNKKRAKGSALMEGSRCSRVNGRGWRCCQQTLVGYSLCEHHLGKGRLRSMTSVRSRSVATSTTTTTTAPPENNNKVHDNMSGDSSSFPEKQTKFVSDNNHDALVNNEEKKPVIITKRRMKLGMVKARSISSLLGQTNTTVAHEDNNK